MRRDQLGVAQADSSLYRSAPLLTTSRGRRSCPTFTDPNDQHGTGFSGILAADGLTAECRRASGYSARSLGELRIDAKSLASLFTRSADHLCR